MSILRTTVSLILKFTLLLSLIISCTCLYVWLNGDTLLKRLIPTLEAQLGQQIGAKVEISTLGISLFPISGISIDSIKIKPSHSCGTIVVEHGSLSMDFRALAQGIYVIDAVNLSSISANITTENGSLRVIPELLEECEQFTATVKSTPRKDTYDESKDGGNSPLLLNLKSLNIENLNLKYVGAKVHTIVVSKLHTEILLDRNLLTAITPQIEATIDATPIDLSAQLWKVDLATLLSTIENASLNIEDQNIRFSGQINSIDAFQNLKIETTELQLSKITKLLQRLEVTVPKVNSGSLTASISVDSSPGEKLEIIGDLRLSDLSLDLLKLKLSDLQLRSARLTLNRQTRAWESTVQVSLKNVSVIDRNFVYTNQKSDGNLRINSDMSGGSVRGQMNILGFGYRDGATELRNVTARVTNLHGSRGHKGGFFFTGDVDGSSLELSNPSVEVRRLDKIAAPVKVEVPALGGYSVSGPMTVRGGRVTLLDREFNDVSGNAKLLVSNALKELKIQQLTTNILGRVFTTSGTLSASQNSLKFHDLQTSVDKGEIALTGKFNFDHERAFTTEITLTNLPIHNLLILAKGVERSPLEGTISSLRTTIHGLGSSPLTSLTGDGVVQVVGPHVKGYNLSRAVGYALSAIPFANLTLSPEEFSKEDLSKTAEGTFSIRNQTIQISKVTIYKPNYTIEGSGTFSFQQEFDMQAAAIFAQESFRKFGGGFDRLGALFARVGRVRIPLLVKGKVPSVSISPDIQTLVRDNTGITFVGDILENTGRAVKNSILNPFKSKANNNKETTEKK